MCGIIASKTVLLFLSLVFWAAGASLTYVGAYVIKSYNNFNDFLEDTYTLIPAAIILGVAIMMVLIGTIGCCATLRESKVGLGFFLVIILVIFVAEVAAFVFGFIYRGRIKGDLEKSMNNVFQKYNGLNAETRAVDFLQTQLQCCGVQNSSNWNNTAWFQKQNSTVPRSCCRSNSTNCVGQLDQPILLNTRGCEELLVQLLQDVLSYAMLVILGFAIIKFFGMLSVCVITCRVRKNQYEPLYS